MRLRGGLSSPVIGLDFWQRFTDVFFVHPAKTLFQQLQACVLVVNNNSGNQAAVVIDRMRSKLDLFIEYKLAHGLLGSLAERLILFRRIDKGDTNTNLFLGYATGVMAILRGVDSKEHEFGEFPVPCS